MTVNVNVIGLLMNLQVLIHSMLNWNLELLGKQKSPEKKKPLRATAREPTTNSTHAPHYGVNVLHKIF